MGSDRVPDPSNMRSGSMDMRALHDALDVYLAGGTAREPVATVLDPPPSLDIPDDAPLEDTGEDAGEDAEPPAFDPRRRALVGTVAVLLVAAGLLVVVRNPFAEGSNVSTSVSAVPATTPKATVATSVSVPTTEVAATTSTPAKVVELLPSSTTAAPRPTQPRPRTPAHATTTAPRVSEPAPSGAPDTTVPATTAPSDTPTSSPPVTETPPTSAPGTTTCPLPELCS